jgi:polygalacturonase
MDAPADPPESERRAKRYPCIQWVDSVPVLLLIAILSLLPAARGHLDSEACFRPVSRRRRTSNKRHPSGALAMRSSLHLLYVATIGFCAAISGKPSQAADSSQSSTTVQRPEIRIGIDKGDIRGDDHRALQAAVDYVAGLGGGTVQVGPGKFTMRNALRLRDNVDIVGVPGKTLLVASNGFSSPLAADGDANERQITVEDPSGFHIGDGVAIGDRDSGGFEVTTAAVVGQTGPNTFNLSEPLYLDYLVSKKAAARLVFPIVGGWNVKRVTIEGLTIDGNRSNAQYIDGCRGAGIYLFECENVSIRNCAVRNYKGDGISFQVSQHITVEDCLSENNGGLGIHPGSGSQHPVVRRNRSLANGSDGLYVCWRVKYGLFAENEIRGNHRAGISIGHKDTDNVFLENIIADNASYGVLFRNEDEAMGAHRNVFERNRILDNGSDGERGKTPAAIKIDGVHRDVVFRDNKIGNTGTNSTKAIGILHGPAATGLDAEQNDFVNVEDKTRITREKQ